MDKTRNPLSPTAASPPTDRASRNAILEQARVLLSRVRAKRPEKSMLLTGARGVGKTVLLHEIECLAKNIGYHTIIIDAQERKALAELLAPHLGLAVYFLK